jgi:threonine-phosphate decarboxylase
MNDKQNHLSSTSSMIITHGGKVYEAARRWGIEADEVTDFSANINPLGMPSAVIAAIKNSLNKIYAYPDEHAFIYALADRYNIASDAIIVGNGSAALMFAVLRAIRPARVLLLEPAFSEYHRACIAAKAAAIRWTLREETGFMPDFASLIAAIEKRRFDLLILNSPHNPTGTLYAKEELTVLIERAEANQVVVMLDEAFIDYAPQSSLLDLAAEKSHCIVLRSLTKFFAMPGLRIGYAVCGTELASIIREQIETWPVSTTALEAGCAALRETQYEPHACRINAQSRKEFAEALHRIGLQVFPSAANFLLAKLPCGSGAELAQWLEPERILIRRCDSFHGLGDMYIRLAVRSNQEHLRLVSLIEAYLAHQIPLKSVIKDDSETI